MREEGQVVLVGGMVVRAVSLVIVKSKPSSVLGFLLNRREDSEIDGRI